MLMVTETKRLVNVYLSVMSCFVFEMLGFTMIYLTTVRSDAVVRGMKLLSKETFELALARYHKVVNDEMGTNMMVLKLITITYIRRFLRTGNRC